MPQKEPGTPSDSPPAYPDPVDDTLDDSFPASDAPAWTGLALGGPPPDDGGGSGAAGNPETGADSAAAESDPETEQH